MQKAINIGDRSGMTDTESAKLLQQFQAELTVKLGNPQHGCTTFDELFAYSLEHYEQCLASIGTGTTLAHTKLEEVIDSMKKIIKQRKQ